MTFYIKFISYIIHTQKYNTIFFIIVSIKMFGIFAVYAVVPYVDALIETTWDIQQVVEEQTQEELQEQVEEEVQGEVLDEIQKGIKQKMLQEILVHNGYSYGAAMQDYVNYAYHLGWIEFVKLIECENGRWDPKRISKTNDRGLCQLNYKYNKNFINSPDFADPYKQLDYCYEKYKINPNLRYWPKRTIEGKKCSDYVSDRFDILVTSNNKLISKNIN